MTTEHTLPPQRFIANLHRLLESTTLMRCASKHVGRGAYRLLAFRTGTPDEVVAQQVAYADEMGMPPLAMLVAVATPRRLSVVVHRISRPMALLVSRLVRDACDETAADKRGEVPESKRVETGGTP